MRGDCALHVAILLIFVCYGFGDLVIVPVCVCVLDGRIVFSVHGISVLSGLVRCTVRWFVVCMWFLYCLMEGMVRGPPHWQKLRVRASPIRDRRRLQPAGVQGRASTWGQGIPDHPGPGAK